MSLFSACKSLLSKGPNFVTTPGDINWYTLNQDFNKILNKFRFYYLNSTSIVTDTTDNNKQLLDEPPPKKV